MILEETHLVLIIITSIFLVSSTEAHNHHNSSIPCQNSCGTGKLIKWVPYPFGFSDGCSIRLNCTQETGDIKIGDFVVQDITPNAIFVSLPAKCNRSLESIKPLFRDNYAPAWRNGLLLQNCNSSLSSCFIPTSTFSNQLHLQNCDSKSDNISCYSREQLGNDVLNYSNLSSTHCKFVFSSFAVGSNNPVVSLEFERVELEWWLEGGCELDLCSKNGNCSQVKYDNGKIGFRCRCNDGYIGDAFKNGEDCRSVNAMPRIEKERGKDDNGTDTVDWFYFHVSIAPGFVVGFWVVMGPLVFNRRWRHFYFNFLYHLWNNIVVWFHVNVVKVVRGQ